MVVLARSARGLILIYDILHLSSIHCCHLINETIPEESVLKSRLHFTNVQKHAGRTSKLVQQKNYIC